MLKPEILPCQRARHRDQAHRLLHALELQQSRLRTLDELRRKVDQYNAQQARKADPEQLVMDIYGARHARTANLYHGHRAVLVVRELHDDGQ